MVDTIVIGSGAAGVAAALELVHQGIQPLVLDVGYTNSPARPRIEGNLYEYRRIHDSFELHIGSDFAGLAGVLAGAESVAKLHAPNMRFVTQDADHLAPVEQVDFAAVQSFALGGLGNAWGAGLYRFVDADLEGFPFSISQLDPYFDKLTREIGISGQDDDLTPFFGDPGSPMSSLLPPLALSHNAGRIYSRYLRRRQRLNRQGFYLGRPRVGALSVAYDGRPPCDYSNLEFWQEQPYLYTPAMTLRKLLAAGKIEYRSGCVVERWEEDVTGIRTLGRELRTGQPLWFAGKKLLVAAGAINTARLALQSARDQAQSAQSLCVDRVELPLLENPILQVPLVVPRSLGRRLDTHAFGLVQLNLVWEQAKAAYPLQGSIVELTSPMRAEFFGRFPVSARANLVLIRYLLPAMVLMHLYWPAAACSSSRISLADDGRLRIVGSSQPIDLKQIRQLLALLRRLGMWTHPLLIQQPITGHAIHYAGTLPMKENPGPFQCHADGRLHGSQHVYIADSASFTSLSAKNMSLGMMANAMRIAAAAARDLAEAS